MTEILKCRKISGSQRDNARLFAMECVTRNCQALNRKRAGSALVALLSNTNQCKAFAFASAAKRWSLYQPNRFRS